MPVLFSVLLWLLWAWFSRTWTGWGEAVVLVKPRDRRKVTPSRVSLVWRWRSRRRSGRPGTAANVRALISTMSDANPL
jgi:hypothetical protein